MDLKRIAAAVALAGVALVVAGTIVRFGWWAMVADGIALVALALAPDWEKTL